MKKLLLVSSLIIVFLMSVSAFAVVKETNIYKLPFSDANKVITVNPADKVITLKLKSNPTTGFSWFLIDYNRHLVRPIEQKFYPPSKEIVGASGFEIWKFALKKHAFVVPQAGMIKLRYMRPWVVNNGQVLEFKVVTSKDFIKILNVDAQATLKNKK